MAVSNQAGTVSFVGEEAAQTAEQIDLDKVFAAVYRNNYLLLARVAASVVGDADIGEELCQEALLKYYQKIACLPHGEEARYWLLRVVRNLALNYAIRRNCEYKANRSYHHNYHQLGYNNGERQILEDESSDLVRQAVLKLPEKLRSVLVLREYGRLNYREIAKALAISVDNVKVRMFRARKFLARLLDKEAVYVS